MGLWNKGGTEREVILREQKDWKKINQKWASMLSHMSLLNVFFCSCCLIVTMLHNYQLFCPELLGFFRLFFFFAGNASQESKQPTAWTLNFIWGEELCYFYKPIKSQLH